MPRPLLLVVKDKVKTSLMQHFDVFESFKFLGYIIEVTQSDTHSGLSAAELLQRMQDGKENSEFYGVVGVIIPSVEAAFLPGHLVYSTGIGWATVRDVCAAFNARLTGAQE